MLYIVKNLRTRPTHLTTYWINIMWPFNFTLIDRVNKLMTNNIRSTYNCHTFLEVSGQVHQTIYRVNIWGYFDSAPKYRVNLVLFWPHIQIGLRNLFSLSRDLCAWYYCHHSLCHGHIVLFHKKSKFDHQNPLS